MHVLRTNSGMFMPPFAYCRYTMVQLTITDPERFEKTTIDTSGRISLGKEHAGKEVEYAVVRITDSGGSDAGAESEEAAE